MIDAKQFGPDAQIPDEFNQQALQARGLFVDTLGQIPLFREPILLTPEAHEAIFKIGTTADALLTRAAAYALTNADLREYVLGTLPETTRMIVEERVRQCYSREELVLRHLQSQQYIRRLDMNISHVDGDGLYGNGWGPRIVELNASCPEGFWYTYAALSLYAQIFHLDTRNLPSPPAMLNTIMAQALRQPEHAGGHNTVAISYDKGNDPVSDVELPRLSEAMQIDARARGLSMIYIPCGVNELQVAHDGSIHLHGRKIDLIWRNWGEEIPTQWVEGILANKIHIINSPEAIVVGLKFLMAVLSSDETFRRSLTREEKMFVQQYLPYTTALASSEQIASFVRQHGSAGWVFKPTGGSSGRGVLIGEQVEESAHVELIQRNLQRGNIYIAQERTLPIEAQLPGTIIRNGQATEGLLHRDLCPYVLHVGNGTYLTGLGVSRGKPTPPINVGGGGGLTILAKA